MMGLAATVGGILLMRKMNAQRNAMQQQRGPVDLPPVRAPWNAEMEPDEPGAGVPSLDADGNLNVPRDLLRQRVASRFLSMDDYA